MGKLSPKHHDLAEESGFTLAELMVVVAILAVLVAAGVASFVGFRDRASDTSTKAALAGVVPSIEAYFADHGTYVGMTAEALRSGYDQSISTIHFTVESASQSTYCVEGNWGSETWRKNGPDAQLEKQPCP